MTRHLFLLQFLALYLPFQTLAGTVCVDPGHGGKDSGAVWGEVLEKDLTFSISRKVAQRLGGQAVMTRHGDVYVSLRERCEVANRSGAEVFVSIHVNSSSVPPKKGGAEVWYYPGSEEGRTLASIIARKIGAERGVKAGRFYVLKHTRMPAVLIECGFINVEQDRQRLCDPAYQEWLADRIVEGIEAYLNGRRKKEVP